MASPGCSISRGVLLRTPIPGGLRPQSQSGRSRRTAKRAAQGGARAGRGRGAGAFGALVAVVAHYEKCSEWRQTRLLALALFGKPPLHFS